MIKFIIKSISANRYSITCFINDAPLYTRVYLTESECYEHKEKYTKLFNSIHYQ